MDAETGEGRVEVALAQMVEQLDMLDIGLVGMARLDREMSPKGGDLGLHQVVSLDEQPVAAALEEDAGLIRRGGVEFDPAMRTASIPGFEDVFTKIDMCAAHYEKVGLGRDFVRQFVR